MKDNHDVVVGESQQQESDDWRAVLRPDANSTPLRKDPIEGRTAAFYWVRMQNFDVPPGARLATVEHHDVGMSSFTEISSSVATGYGRLIWLTHQANPERHEHEVLVYGPDGDEDPDTGILDPSTVELRRAAAVQRRYKVEARFFGASRLLAISAPSEIAKRVTRDMESAGILDAEPVSIDLRKLKEHEAIKDVIAAWADGSENIRTRAVFGSRVLEDKRGIRGDLRSIRVVVNLGHTERGVMISRDGRLTILGHDGRMDNLVDLFRDLQPLIGVAPPSQSTL